MVLITINNKNFSYLVNGHKSIYKSNTTFNEIKQITCSTNLVFKNGSFKKHKYWFPKYNPKVISEQEAINFAKHYLTKSLKRRLRSDVNRFCLSGGVDSSSLVSLAAKELNYDVNTFSIIDSDNRYNELNNIKIQLVILAVRITRFI